MGHSHQLQLNPPIPVDVIHKGKMQSGVALLVTLLGPEWHRVWTVCLDEDGAMWDFENPCVRGTKNITHGRRLAEPPQGATEKAILDTMRAKRSGFAVTPEMEDELDIPAYLRKPDRSTDHDGHLPAETHPGFIGCQCKPCKERRKRWSADARTEAKEAAQEPGKEATSFCDSGGLGCQCVRCRAHRDTITTKSGAGISAPAGAPDPRYCRHRFAGDFCEHCGTLKPADCFAAKKHQDKP